MVADIILAEPNALIGFAGPRVIQTTLRQELPEGFQRSEFLLRRGQIDRIVSREELPDMLFKLLEYLNPNAPQPPRTSAHATSDSRENRHASLDPGSESIGELRGHALDRRSASTAGASSGSAR
jgi:hypothetical protein